MQNYTIVADVWEADTALDLVTLRESGVAGLIIRLNDMNGGHHMDANFKQQWYEAGAAGLLRAPYFVYNPWVNGRSNYAWLMANLPPGVGRVFVDIEVIYPGFSPVAYAADVLEFIELLQPSHPVTVYTGEWFLTYLASWPENVGYWWAQYMTALRPAKTTSCSWDDLRRILAVLPGVPTNANKCAGKIDLWQITADRLILPGSPKPLDINVYQGTVEQLAEWFGTDAPQPIPVPQPSVPSGLYVFSKSAYWQRPNGGPLVTPTYNITKTSAQKELILDHAWMGWMARINSAKAYAKIIAKNWGPSKGINGNGKLIFNTLIYPGRNVVKVVNTMPGLDGAGWAQIAGLPENLIPGSVVNQIDTPHLVHKVYGSNSKWTAVNLVDAPWVPLIGAGRWVRLEWLESVDAMLPKLVRVNAGWGVNIRETPSVTSARAGYLLPLQSVTVHEVRIAPGGIWGKIDKGWIALRYNDQNLTNWAI